jgi:hypothetical protein
MVSHLYRIENTKTGEYYIGKHNGVSQEKSNGRLYWGSGDRIKRQVKKYGVENFTYTVLVIAEEDYIYDLEKKMVTVNLIESDKKCLNLVGGGFGPSAMTKDIKKKLSKSIKKAYENPEARKRISDGVKKYFAENPEVVARIAEKNRNRITTEETKQKLKKVLNSPEVKKKLIESHLGQEPWNKGVPMSKEQLEKMTVWAKEYWKDKPGFFTGKTHDVAAKDKMKLAWEKRKKEKKGLTIGYTFINNKQENKFVPPELLQEYLDSGWLKGMMKRNKS